jgi:hypothetical protein
MSGRPGILAQIIFYVCVVIIALGGLTYSFVKWLREDRKAVISKWRRVLVYFGFLAVGSQSALFLAFFLWHRISRDRHLIGVWANLTYPAFIAAIPLVLAGKGTSRWWLFSSSIILFVLCFFMSLVP